MAVRNWKTPISSFGSDKCSGQDFEDFARDLLGIFDLTQNSNLHVVNEQRGPARVAHVLESLWDVQSEGRLHRVE